MNNLLALDLGTQTGWAHINTFGKLSSGSVCLQSPRQRQYETPGIRWVRLANHLREWGPSLIVVEEVRRHKGTIAAHVYGGALATVQAYCESNGCEMTALPVATVKKHATGKGNASKKAMVKAAIDRLGASPYDDNEADALWILDCFLKGGAV